MELSRREFLKLGGVTTVGIFVFEPLGFERALAASPKGSLVKKRIGEKTTI